MKNKKSAKKSQTKSKKKVSKKTVIIRTKKNRKSLNLESNCYIDGCSK